MKQILVLFVFVMMGFTNVWAYDFSAVTPSGQTLYYNVIDGNAVVSAPDYDEWGEALWNDYAMPTGSLSIPERVSHNGATYSVTSIGDMAFNGCSGLTSVTIPNSVTKIGCYAFNGCSGLTSISIPNSVNSISYAAFADCSGLTSVSVDAGNAYFDSRNNCNAIIETATNKLICGCKSTIIPNSVTTIGRFAFCRCSGLTGVTIPNSVTEIEMWAFDGCKDLLEVTIPSSVTEIGFEVFANCSGLTSMTVESGNTEFDSRNNCNAIIGTSENILLYGCKNTIIPSSVTEIDGHAFDGCSGLTHLFIPNSVTTIGDYAFRNCSNFTSVTIPNSVTEIGKNAFHGVGKVCYCGSAEGSPWGAIEAGCFSE